MGKKMDKNEKTAGSRKAEGKTIAEKNEKLGNQLCDDSILLSWSRGKSQGFLFNGALNDPLCQAFFEYCLYQRGLSTNTITAYYSDLRIYDVFLTDKGIDFKEVQIREIDEFISYLGKVKNNSKRTIARKIETLRALYRYLYRIDEIKTNIMKKVDSPKLDKPLPKYLTNEQQEKLINYFETKPGYKNPSKWIKRRGKAIVIMFLDTGLRLRELCNAKIKNLDFDNRILRVMGKGGKESELILSSRLVETLKQYIDNVRPHLLKRGYIFHKKGNSMKPYHVYMPENEKKVKYYRSYETREAAEKVLNEVSHPDHGYLFCRGSKPKLDTRHVYRILYLAGKALGFEVHTHLLRHTFASNLRMKGADLLLVKEALRHEDVSTMQIYAHISNDMYRKQMRKYLDD